MLLSRDLGFRRVLGPSLVAALLAAGSAMSQSGDRVAVKRLFAPPAAVLDGSLSLPDPARGAVASTAAMCTLAGAGDAVEVEHGGGAMRALPIAAPGFRGTLTIAPAGARGSGSTVTLPVGSFDGRVPRVDARPVALDALGIGAETSLSEFTLPAGRYRISFAGDAGTPVFAALGDASDVALVAHRADAVVRAGEPLAIRVEARRPAAAPPLEDLSFAARARAGTPLPFAIDAARVRFADGSVAEGVARVARDGSATVAFPPGIAGDALVEISAAVRDGTGLRTRSVALLTRIARAGTRLAATPSIAAVADGGWLELAIPVESDEESLVAATEVWAVGPRGERPLGWLGGIAEVEADEDLGPTVRLGVAAARLAIDDSERLEARGLRFHEREGFATLAAVDRIGIDFDREDRSAAASAPAPDADWMGRPGVATVAAGATGPLVPGPGSHVRGLVHGYCADANAWPAAQFGPEAWVYEAVNQNWPNDTFALDLLARSGQFKSLGVVAHSQGGMAALHLYTFYFSGLDWAGPGRLIQTVGGPFEGTPIAGVLAALGAIFGVQCGANYDMTPEGAAIWLATIPPAPRAKVFTFTTSYTGPGWSGYCSLATALFLAFPEDGVTEHSSGHFPGANDLGLTYGWCHVDGMRDPDQALDASRNAAMREAGAR